MIKHEGEIPYFEFSNLARTGNVASFVTTRLGGKSLAPRDSLNMSFDNGDNPGMVVSNRKAFLESIGLNIGQCVFAEQVHGSGVASVSKKDMGSGSRSPEGEIKNVDGLVTDAQNLCLCVVSADCLPVILYDPDRQVVGIAHAGRKGLAKGILSDLVEKMKNDFDSQTNNIIVGIGPGVDKENYEVREKDIQDFEDYSKAYSRNGKEDSYLLDLNLVAQLQLKKSGISSRNMEISELSTYKSNNLFFSYRRERPNGAIMTGVMLL